VEEEKELRSNSLGDFSKFKGEGPLPQAEDGLGRKNSQEVLTTTPDRPALSFGGRVGGP